MGKGSTPRPFSIAHDEYANRWDAIWGKDKQKIEEDTVELEEDDEEVDCPVCRTELYRTANGRLHCDICGYSRKLEHDHD